MISKVKIEMTFDEVLRRSGVTSTTIPEDVKRALDTAGYAILPWIEEVEALRSEFERIAAKKRPGDAGRESGTRHLKDLLNSSAAFIDACLHPRILEAVHHILKGPFKLTQCSGRDPLPGYGRQGLHSDWMPRRKGEPHYVATAICMLDDFTPDNGATRLVPGTHLLYGSVPKNMADPAAHHPEEVIVKGRAGSVLIFNGHLWHSGTLNRSRNSRRSIQCVFHVVEVIPPHAMSLHDRPEMLDPAIRYLL